MDIKHITLEDVKNLGNISEKELKKIDSFNDKDISDCPELSPNQLSKLKPFYESHPEWYKVVVAKTPIQIRIDNDVLAELKKEGKGYQTKINAILRKYVFG